MDQVSEQAARLSPTIFECVQEPVAIADMDRGLVFWNKAFANLVGHHGPDGDGFSSAGADWDPLETREVIRLVNGETTVVAYDKHYTHREGHTVPIRVRVSMLKSNDGSGQAYLVVARPNVPQQEGRSTRVECAAREWDLTGRQTEVLELLARGLGNKEIASRLQCAESTVEFHVTALLRKSSTTSRANLIWALYSRW
ncbi:MAG: LuxR C-terminal-related transcriptional regulator [Myxococcota bacterium]